MADMIDAMILIHAIGVEIGHVTRERFPRWWEQARASHCLVRETEMLTISAYTWYEVERGLTPEQQVAFDIYKGRLNVPPFDARVAKRGASIYRAARSRGTLCPKCLASIKHPATCPKCGCQRSTDKRSGDILMVATALVTAGVGVLYTWDKGVLALADHAEGLHISNPPPPNPEQLDMYDTVDLDAECERRLTAGSGDSE